jgi:hypothetical protein
VLHPIAKDDDRGHLLREALVNGKYDDVATAADALPECARRFLKVSERKTITKGPEAGNKVSEEHLEHCEAPYRDEGFEKIRKGMNQSKRPGLSKLSKRPLHFCDKKFWETRVAFA